jgi:hypothetical protein
MSDKDTVAVENGSKNGTNAKIGIMQRSYGILFC